MKSIYDDLAERLALDPSVARRTGPRQDIGILLFSQRDDIAALWKAADRSLRGLAEPGELSGAVERLRPLFGER